MLQPRRHQSVRPAPRAAGPGKSYPWARLTAQALNSKIKGSNNTASKNLRLSARLIGPGAAKTNNYI